MLQFVLIARRTMDAARPLDDRRVISDVLHVLRAGCRWCDLPQRSVASVKNRR